MIDIEVYVVHSRTFQAMVDLLHGGLAGMKKTWGQWQFRPTSHTSSGPGPGIVRYSYTDRHWQCRRNWMGLRVT